MTKSRLRDRTEPVVFVPEVAKQHDVFAGATAFGVLESACASFWLDKKIWKLSECLHEDLLKPVVVPATVLQITCIGGSVERTNYLKVFLITSSAQSAWLTQNTIHLAIFALSGVKSLNISSSLSRCLQQEVKVNSHLKKIHVQCSSHSLEVWVWLIIVIPTNFLAFCAQGFYLTIRRQARGSIGW